MHAALEQEISGLEPAERDLLLAMLQERSEGKSDLFKSVVSNDFRWTPPSIEDFLEDPFFAGSLTKTIRPRQYDLLLEVFNDPSCIEIILTGGLGWGKTWGANLGLAYDLCLTGCLRNPYEFFPDVSEATEIVFANFSVSWANALSVSFTTFYRMLLQIPFFQECFPWRAHLRDPNRKQPLMFVPCPLRFPNGVTYRVGNSSELSAVGMTVLSGLMDEANFFLSARRSKNAIASGDLDQARVLHNALVGRRRSRFMQKGGRVFGHFWAISSKQFPGDFLEQRVKEIRDGGDATAKVYDYSIWDVRGKDQSKYNPKIKRSGSYGDKWFWFRVGNATVPSGVIEGANTREEAEKDLPEECSVLTAPAEYLQAARVDPNRFLRDDAGVSVQFYSQFIRDRVSISACIDQSRQHPMAVETAVGSINHNDIKWDLLVRDGSPILHPNAIRFFHGDMSETEDCSALAIGHYHGTVQVDPLEALSLGLSEQMVLPIIYIDFMLEIKAPVGGEIDSEVTRNIILWFRKAGFRVKEGSYDQYQSTTNRQALNRIGVDTVKLSVDAKPDAYKALKDAMYQRRIRYYHYDPFFECLGYLQRDEKTGKIDHVPGGKKDVSDAVAGVVIHCLNNFEHRVEVLPVPVRGVMLGSDGEEERDDQRYANEFPVADLYTPEEAYRMGLTREAKDKIAERYREMGR